jgi:hypothetical protein
MMHLFSTILHVRCVVLDRDCNGRCVGTHGKNVQQCHSPDSGTINQKCQPKCLCLLQQSCLVCLIPGLKVQVQQFTPSFFLIWTNKLISTKPGNFDNRSKPCRLNYPIWNVLSMEQISNDKLKCSIMAFANIPLVLEGCRYLWLEGPFG